MLSFRNKLILNAAVTALLTAPVLMPAAVAQPSYPLVWSAKPQQLALKEEWKKYSAVILQDDRRLEYKAGDDKNIYVYRTYHRRARLLDDKGMESFNKCTLYSGADREISNIKARTILPGGRIIDVRESDIRIIKTEGGGQQYLFAMDGIEKGADVELMYTEKKPFVIFSSETYQTVIPVAAASFSMIVPEHLKYEFANYHGFPKAEDSAASKLHFYQCAAANIPAMKEEAYSNADASLQRIDFKLSYVQGDQKDVRRFTWNELAKQLYTKYATFTDKELRIAGKYLASIKVAAGDDELVKIQKIEDAVKTGITTSDDVDAAQDDFDKIVDKKLTTERGQARFLAACLTEAGVKYEFGLTASRYKYMLDESLEIWTQLNDYIIYLPNQRSYLAPTAITYRVPFVPYVYMGNKGIFSKVTSVGTLVSAVPDIRAIATTPMEKNISGVDADIHFTKADMTPEIKLTHSFNGQPAANMRAVFIYVSKDKEKELVQELTGLESKPGDIHEYSIENKPFSAYYTGAPLNMKVTLQAPQLMEKAGAKYLFSVGRIIGRQSEMYNDEERRLPLEIQFPHVLPRTIRITVPEGYRIVNPEAVRLHVTGSAGDDNASLAFHSDYKMSGNIMEININEIYSRLNYPISDYTLFRNVVNAAADFTKIVLVLEKI